MFASRQRGTLIAKGLKIVGSVTAEGLVEVNGQIDGELHCTSLVIARGAHVNGTVAAEHVVVDGTVEGPIHGGDVTLKSQAHVVGDIHHQSLASRAGDAVWLDINHGGFGRDRRIRQHVLDGPRPRQRHTDRLFDQRADPRQDLLFRQQGSHGRVHEGPDGQSREGAGLLLKEASWVGYR